MNNLKLSEITETDLQRLIDNKVIESRQLEYKRDLTINQSSEKKEFLADVSSFANSTGGDLIIGIEADSETGEPTEITGIELENIDSEILKIESLIRDGISPRVWDLRIQPIAISDNRTVLIIRIPNSWISPHRVDLQGHNKFYTRGSNGKYPMDVDELRVAFNISQTISEKIRNFRIDRINNIYANQSYLPLPDGAKVILHLIPFSAFSPANTFDFHNIQDFKKEMRPMRGGGWDYQFNLDGFMCYTGDGGYTQVFKNGIIEAVNSSLLLETMGQKSIPSASLERMILESYEEYKNILITRDVSLPIAVALTITGIKDYSFAAGDYMPLWGNKFPHGKDILTIPENLIQDFSTTYSTIFKPVFDSLWNSYGHEKSKNFNDAGVWGQT